MAHISTYSEWVSALDRFGNGDDTAIDELKMATFKVDAGTARRFYERIELTYKKRKQSWLDKFQKSLQFQKTSVENIEMIFRNGKQSLLVLVKFTNLNGLPDDLKKILQSDLYDFAEEIKRSMRGRISTHTFREHMSVLLNAFSLPISSPEAPQGSLTKKDEINSFSSGGRKIIFQHGK